MKNRVASICIGTANLLIAATTFFVQGFSSMLSIYFAGVFAAAVSMLAAVAKKNREGVLIMKIVKNWFLRIASSAAAIALIVAVASASATCFFTAYQPDVPKALQ